MDNNLLWRSKAYSFGHFVCDLCGDAAHVQDTCSPFPLQRLLLVAAWDVHLHYSFAILKKRGDRVRQGGIIMPFLCYYMFVCVVDKTLFKWHTVEILLAWVLTIVHMVKPSKDEVYSNPCIDTYNQ